MANRLPLLAWLLALMGVWMLCVVSTALPELALGACCAVVATVLVAILRHESGPQPPPKARWWMQGLRLVPRLFSDTFVVFAVLFRRLARRQLVSGAFRAVPYSGVFVDEGTAVAGDAFVIAANSLTPNTIVVDIDRLEGRLLLHQLAPEPPAAIRRGLVGPA